MSLASSLTRVRKSQPLVYDHEKSKMAHSLPTEAYEHIVNSIDDVEDLKNISLTSKNINRLAKRKLWKAPALKFNILRTELAKLGHLPIKELNLEHFPIMDEARDINLVTDMWLVTLVNNWKNLTSLYLKYCGNLTDDGITLLAKLRQLKCLHLPKYCKNITIEGVVALVDLPLEELSISRTKSKGQIASVIGRMPRLRRLYLRRTCIGIEMQHLSCLTKLRVLKIVDGSSLLSEDGLACITHLPIEELSIQGLQRFDSDFAGFVDCSSLMRVIGEITSLKKLELRDSMYSNDCMAYLGKLCNLTVLHFSLSALIPFTIAGMVQIAPLMLSELTIGEDGVHITDGCMDVISCLTRLTKLSITGAEHLTDLGMSYMCGLVDLKYLYLDESPKITASGLREIQLLPLEELSMSNSNLNDTSMQTIGKMKYLRKLDMSDSPDVTNTGLEYLSSLHKLTWLNINYCDKITPSALNAISHLPLEALFFVNFDCIESEVCRDAAICLRDLKILQTNDNNTFVRKKPMTPFQQYVNSQMERPCEVYSLPNFSNSLYA